MKKIILVIGALCLLANLLFGGMISAYEKFNVGLNCGVIVVNTLLIYLTAAMRPKDGYKIPLSGLFGFLAVVEYVVCLFAPAVVEDNVSLLVVVALLLAEAVALIVSNYASKA